MGLKYCSNCRENSVATKTYQKKGAKYKSVFEYCINKNPSCQYKKLIKGVDYEQAGKTVREGREGEPDHAPEAQLELF